MKLQYSTKEGSHQSYGSIPFLDRTFVPLVAIKNAPMSGQQAKMDFWARYPFKILYPPLLQKKEIGIHPSSLRSYSIFFLSFYRTTLKMQM